MIGKALQVWRRRYWRADASKLAAYQGLTPFTVITGGSEGIGLALAVEFARLGNNLLIIGRDAAKFASAQAEIDKAFPKSRTGRVATLALDITGDDACTQLDAKLAELGGYCDVLVNSAGVGLAGAFTDNDPKRLDALLTLNITALTRLCRHHLPAMVIRGSGGILNVASLAGYVPGPYQAAYYASKSYVISLTEALAQECAGYGVRLAVLNPGAVRTDFHTRMNGETGLYLKLLPVATPSSVARTAVFRFRLGQRVIVPGIFGLLTMLSLRILPHRVSTPIIAVLLKPRGETGHGTRQP